MVSLTKTRCLTPILAIFLALVLFPIQIHGQGYEESTYVDKKDNYQERLSGINTILFQMPVYDFWGGHFDRWVSPGVLYYSIVETVDGELKAGEKVKLFEWQAEKSIPDRNWNNTWVSASDIGSFEVTPGTGENFFLGGGRELSRYYPVEKRGSLDYFTLYVEWTVPNELRGKRLRFFWDVNIGINDWDHTTFKFNIERTNNDINVPEGTIPNDPSITDPILLPENKGMLAVPWFISAQTVISAKAFYLDNDSVEQEITLGNGNNGYVMVPATEPHRSLFVNVSYSDYLGYVVPDRQSSPKKDIPIIHAPINFKATPQDDGQGSVLLEWETKYNDYPEYFETDLFEIQRSVSGKDEDFELLTTVALNLDTAYYSFKDSTLLQTLAKNQDFYRNTPRYRIRRMITSTWDWEGNPTVSEASANLRIMGLLTPINATADWENEDEHKVKVTWDYGQDYGIWTVWDNRAEMLVRLNTYNRDGELLDTRETTMAQEDVLKREWTLQLNRSCVNYTIELLGHSKTSPFSFFNGYDYSEDFTIPVAGPESNSTFNFQSIGKVEKTLMAESRQSSVILTWDTDGGPVDYFQVLRREEGTTEWTVIADYIEESGYEDKSVSPLLNYEYKVRSAVDCEGTSYNETDIAKGACKHTGMVDGYVHYPDGTGVPGIPVAISSDGKQVASVTTDEKGYFKAEGLPYNNSASVTYTVAPVGQDNVKLEVESYDVTFNGSSNYQALKPFVVTSAYRFSGYVMYDGTSIPVKGAHFTVNGHEVHTSNGKALESDFDGKFSFYVNAGDNVIQATMDGHNFTNEGYYKSKDSQHFTEDVSDIFFYDATKVKLIGRIVGGDTQGNLPLDNNLSRNNLGNGVKMILTLEGDNSSWLVYDNLNPSTATRDEVIPHKSDDHGTYQTTVHTTRKRIEVSPDPKTGEYTLYLPPVRWKVQQVYANGYPTLFQDGMVSEVIDLTECLTSQSNTIEGYFQTAQGTPVNNPVETYNAKYCRIYHNPVELTCRQVGYDTFEYFGDKVYVAQTISGVKSRVPLAYLNADGQTTYTFGHPVFSLGRTYPMQLSAVERYYWNNNPANDTIDVVKVGGGEVTIQNGLLSGTHKDVVKLDDNGEGYYSIQIGQATYLLTGDNALRTVTMTLLQDGTHYEAKPIQGYVFNIFSVPGTKDVLSVNTPILTDILRDPPGGGSTATLHKGSTLTNSYSLDMSMKIGAKITISTGTTLDNFVGSVVIPAGAPGTTYGLYNSSDNETLYDNEFGINAEGNRSFSYTMNLEEDITTSGDPTMTGTAADLYIGTMNNIVVTPAYTIRAVPDSIFLQMAGMEKGASLPTGKNAKYGNMVEIARGTDADGNVFHLISDQSLAYGPKVESRFIYSQKYILEQLIPSLVEQCRALMFIGTAEEAQARANATGRPVYRSLLQPTDPLFGQANVKNGNFIYVTSDSTAIEGMGYVIHLPQGIDKKFEDEVQLHWSSVLAWMQMIILNEREKLSVDERDLIKNYSLDGGSSVNYSETFSSEYSTSFYMKIPVIRTANYFTSENDKGVDLVLTGLNYVLVPLLSHFVEEFWGVAGKKGNISEDGKQADHNNNTIDFKVNFAGSSFGFKLLPTFDYQTKGVGSDSKSYERRESFNIDLNSKSHIDFDVYKSVSHADSLSKISILDVYTSQNLNSLIKFTGPFIEREMDISNWIYPRGFIYRTRGGATARPWEPGYKSMFYNYGVVIDERTKKIENPKIKLDKQSISGVPHGEPARFKLYLTNESEEPEAASGGLAFYNLYMDETTNKDGIKIYIDGTPLTGGGRNLRLTPGEVTEKTIEVYAGDGFDYEGITLGIMSQGDFDIWDEVSFDVHYLREAGSVEISTPSDKWVMNTDAQYNEDRGYFIPVVISGFNKHQSNFDHIELQYKESARGDDYWTNLCSYYADSTLMAKANGQTAMIPENGNINAKFYGEGVVMENAYDLRAVLYCRDGDKFLTSTSKVLSGVKDTRRPQIFGTPEPSNGIINAGDNIVFNFSEDIEYNYLRETTHFEVKGEINNDNVSDNVSIRFDGQSSVETEAQRNFNGKDLTIDMLIQPDDNGNDMPLFSHGNNGKKLQLWITKEKHLKAVVGKNEFVSDSVLSLNHLQQVAMVITQPEEGDSSQTCHLALYRGGVQIGYFDMPEPYTGVGPLIFGRTNETNRKRSTYYEGRMKEARLWYRALSGELIGTTYGNKRLTGYEMGLVDYYPMDEGTGNYAIDKTQGANAQLINASWAMPGGMSLLLGKDDKGLALNANTINRSREHDYTLMFWFKTDTKGQGPLISNGSGNATDIGAKNQFYIGLDADKLQYRSNGMTVDVPGTFTDNAWHHYAMTVNRTMNVANIYIDGTLRSTFDTDSLGGISGGHPILGATIYDQMVNGQSVTTDSKKYLQGHLDEICLFAQALPLTLIKNYITRSPAGNEAGLLTYMSFERQERQKDNSLAVVPYAYSKKIYTDTEGNTVYEKDPLTQESTGTPERDYPFDSSVDMETVITHIDKTQSAPMRPYEEMHNLKYSFTGKDNQIMVNINELNTKINKRNVYVTVREIPDKNGNVMASPVTACYYIDCNPLTWKEQRLRATSEYGIGTQIEFNFNNNSGVRHTYTIENIPRWLNVDNYTNIIGAQESETVYATVNKNLNVGSYDEVIYLVDEDGLTEPLYLTLTVEGEEPGWAVSGDLLQQTMNIIGEVVINGEIDIDNRDLVGVFDDDNQCHGSAHIDYSELNGGESRVYLTVYDKKTTNSHDRKQLHFRLWNYATGLVMPLNTAEDIYFTASDVIGADTPLRLEAGEEYVQYFDLKKGWNWVSFNVTNQDFLSLNNLLDAMPWKNGDILTDMNSNLTLVYRDSHWRLSGDVTQLSITPKRSYAVKVQDDIIFPVTGTIIKDKTQRTITVKKGWNGIGYTPMMTLEVETALSDYYDKAEDGDVIKSHEEFAVFQKVNGVGRWKGNLLYMKPGEGYMLMRKNNTSVSFAYPFYEPGSIFLYENARTSNTNTRQALPHTMSLSAITTGVELLPGDRLLAYADGELHGVAEATADSVFYMSVAGDKQQPLWFAIERDGEIIATTGEVLSFQKDAVVGTPSMPTTIDFAPADIQQEGWFTIDGIQLQGRPSRKGVYIYNGKKILVK